jgi:hypothetical protein
MATVSIFSLKTSIVRGWNIERSSHQNHARCFCNSQAVMIMEVSVSARETAPFFKVRETAPSFKVFLTNIRLFSIGPENWLVYKCWWGNAPVMVKGDITGIAGVNSFNSMHPVRLVLHQLRNMRSLLPSLTQFSLFLFPEKTLCQWPLSYSYRSRSRCTTCRVGACLSQIWWRPWCHLYRPYQYDICLCGDGN